MADRVLVATATFNEVDNVGSLVAEIKSALPSAEILIIDDSSPDGTARIIETLQNTDPLLHLICRPRKLGLGTAHKLIMKFAVKNAYDILITMDADFSHHPKYLPCFISSLQNHDFAIGSRYVAGGKCDYGPARIALSRTANFLTKCLLGVPLKDCTTAFRGYRRRVLEKLDLDSIRSDGYSFFVESACEVTRHTVSAGEFPIHFEDRRAGATKISKKEILNGVRTVFRLTWQRFSRGSRVKPVRPVKAAEWRNCSACNSPYLVEVDPSVTADHLYPTNGGVASDGRIFRCLECGQTSTISEHPSSMDHKPSSKSDSTPDHNGANARVMTFRCKLGGSHPLLPAASI